MLFKLKEKSFVMSRLLLLTIFTLLLTSNIYAQIQISDSDFNSLVGKYSPAKSQINFTTKSNLEFTTQIGGLKDGVYHLKDKPLETTAVFARQIDLKISALETGKTTKFNGGLLANIGFGAGIEYIRAPTSFKEARKNLGKNSFGFFSLGIRGQAVQRKILREESVAEEKKLLLSLTSEFSFTRIHNSTYPKWSISGFTAIRYGSNYQELPSYINTLPGNSAIAVSKKFTGIFGDEQDVLSSQISFGGSIFHKQIAFTPFLSLFSSEFKNPEIRFSPSVSLLSDRVELSNKFSMPKALGLGYEISSDRSPRLFLTGSISF